MRCRAIAAGLIAAAAAAAAAGTASPAKAEPPPGGGDTTPPTITIKIPASPWQGWYANPVNVQMSATDASGVEYLHYRLTGEHTGEETSDTGSSAVTISRQGVTTITVSAIDLKGNGATRDYNVGIDLSDPTVTFGGTATNGQPLHPGDVRPLTFGCADVPTGVAACTGRIGDQPFASGDPLPTDLLGPRVVTVTAIDQVGRWVERQFPFTVTQRPLQVNGRPSISGNPGTVRVGDTLAATGGTFTPAATHLEYRWKVGDREPVTGQTYVVTPDDLGKRIRLSVVGSRAEHAPTTAEATNDVPVVTGTYLVTGNPTVTGTAREGSTLALAEPAAITPRPGSIESWWTIGGTTFETDQSRLTLTSAHVGKRLSCVLRLSGPGYDETAVPCRFAGGATSVVVTGNAWTVRAPARLAGKAKIGKQLRAVAPALSGRADRYAYQWLRNGKAIKGATAAAYRPRAKDVKARISVRITATTAHRPATVSVSPAQRVRR
ncbi:hypothetical protein [Pimelobacter simplex]|uniref:hypothetical protein n=1 Tax=Nocardioides simplex TaxID=2045 RepID=UPI003AAF3A30